MRNRAVPFTLLFSMMLLVFSMPALAQAPGTDDSDKPDKNDSGHFFHFKFKNKPSLLIGQFARVDVKSKWHFDYEKFYPQFWNPPGTLEGISPQTDYFQLTRARVGVKGNVTSYFDYEVEREFRQDLQDQPLNDFKEAHAWKDVYLEAKVHRAANVKVGKFKLPFGLEENTPEDKRDFINQSRVTDILAPARERGAMLHGSLMKEDRLNYAFGAFQHDGENADIQKQSVTGTTYAARINGTPLRALKGLPKTVRHLYLGFATTLGRLEEGQNGLQGETVANLTFVDRMFVRGNRQRIGAELSWIEGPFSVKSEYIRVADQRKGQGLLEEDLPDAIGRGWYVTGTWTVLGEMKSNGGAPKKPFLTGKGYGAVEVAARLDVTSFYSAAGGPVGRSPRSYTILPNSDREWTFGTTWYLNHFVKLQVNAQREWLTDISRKLVVGRNVFWTGIARLQLAM